MARFAFARTGGMPMRDGDGSGVPSSGEVAVWERDRVGEGKKPKNDSVPAAKYSTTRMRRQDWERGWRAGDRR